MLHSGPRRTLFVVSDSTGETAEKMVRAALRQFDVPEETVDVRLFAHVRHELDLDVVVGNAEREQGLIVSTLVRGEERDALLHKCHARGVLYVDLIGSLLGTMARFLSVQPREVPGLLHTVTDSYFQRMEAIEFTVQHDDGRCPEELCEADLVLIGISRTSKTPLSIYLAQKGYRVANVPFVLNVPLPPEIEDVPPARVFVLQIKPDALLQIRHERLLRIQLATDTSYGQRDHILREIYSVRDLLSQHPGWTAIDVTGKAIEETAADVLRHDRERKEQRVG
ncbi:MAG TPA: pyruvate, water dikinase regulatory protein [Pseudomonadota bacterium]|jgi:regulator of PEP synthase PpsR (kinase-PPPase family)|nr:pyruvate, water dikinase regulatory protein [Pseudomonadota bacterium]